jgi:hypothetical protein
MENRGERQPTRGDKHIEPMLVTTPHGLEPIRELAIIAGTQQQTCGNRSVQSMQGVTQGSTVNLQRGRLWHAAATLGSKTLPLLRGLQAFNRGESA